MSGARQAIRGDVMTAVSQEQPAVAPVPADDVMPVAGTVMQSPREASPRRSGWKLFGQAVLWCLAAFASAALVSFFVGVVAGATGLTRRLPPADLNNLYLAAGIFGSVLVFLWRGLHGTPAGARQAGVRRPLLLLALGGGMTLYAAAMSLGIYGNNPQLLRHLVEPSLAVQLLMPFAAVLLAPLGEELFFRGWLWEGLAARWSAAATASATSLLFLCVHLPDGLGRATLLIPLVLTLSAARHFCGGVRASVMLHVWNNAVATAMPWLGLWLGWLAWP